MGAAAVRLEVGRALGGLRTPREVRATGASRGRRRGADRAQRRSRPLRRAVTPATRLRSRAREHGVQQVGEGLLALAPHHCVDRGLLGEHLLGDGTDLGSAEDDERSRDARP